jgi:zinc transport system substrate-binding protein
MQAEAIAEALGERQPEHNDAFQENLAALKRDLEDLGARLKRVAGNHPDQPLLASHPVYGYLARYCGWKLQSRHWEPDQMPDEKQWEELDSLLADYPAQWMIWEGEPEAAIVAKLAERGIGCAVFSPCGNVPAEGDYLQVMQANTANLQAVFGATAR